MREIRIEPPLDFNGKFDIDLKVKVGDRLRPGVVVAILETEKTTQELESYDTAVVVGVEKTERGFVLRIEEEA
jgi:biotin carboxyl carrier protein